MASAKQRNSGSAQSTPSRARHLSGALIICIAMALIAGLVFVAVGADGRELSRASSNDGGAWLVNRSLSTVAHRNRATGELSSLVRVTDSPTADVYQASDLVVVHDPSSNQLFEIDTRSFVEDLQPTDLPEFSTVTATADAIVVMRTDPLTVWRIEQGQLPGVRSALDIDPVISSAGMGRIAVSPDGRIVAIDDESRELTWVSASGAVSPPLVLDFDGEVSDVSIVEASAVVLVENGDLVVASIDEIEHVIRWQDQSVSDRRPARLQQSSTTADSYGPSKAKEVSLITTDGELITVSLGTEPSARILGTIPGGSPVAPIVHRGCVYGVATNPPNFGVACDEFRSQPLASAGENLRLRLVNGWVWVNDVDSGTAYSTDENLDIQQFDDWGPAQEIAQEDQIDEDTAPTEQDTDPDGDLIEDPDAAGSVQSSDDFDPSQANVPPVAVDDATRTRADRAIVVDVLENDTDANNDILIVTSVEPVSGSAAIKVTPSGAAVQVTPSAGFVGTVQFRYSISDGKSDPVSALVSVDVLPAESTNRPPLAVTDVIATSPGHSTTVDVLRNDSDPDGDAIALRSIETPAGATLRWDPIGQVTFTPDNTTEAGWIELPYVVTDDLGAETEGLLRVEIRDDGANQEPDARNDQATTVVGRAIVINLLANDSDPDGDPLIVGSQPRLLEPAGAVVQTTTTSDGEFVFRSEVAGTYLFSYTANDAADSGSESDTARIRVDVLPAVQNQPPVAVRDDIVIAVGESRIVDALSNDGDPDGDLVSIVDWQTSPGLQVTEFNDGSGHVGFQITVEPGAVSRPTMTYWISDGVNDPVSAPIVVAVVQRTATDQPPFANDDVIEARAGSVVTGVKVLANDFDPEAGPLRVIRVGEASSADVSIGPDDQAIDLTISPEAVSSFSIPYDIEDQAGNRAGAVLRVQLISANAPNRPPIARTDDARTKQGDAVFIDVLGNDSDPDSDAIFLQSVTAQPRNGVAEITEEGAIRYQPDPGFSGTDVLRYSIVDLPGDPAIGDVFIGVQEEDEVNLPPIANDDSFVLAGVPSTTPLDVTANDFDPEGDPLRVVTVSSPTHGFVAVDEFGRVEFQPPAFLDQAVSATFDYVIVDSVGNQAQATVTVELEAFEARPEPTPEVPAEPEPTPDPQLAATPTPTPTPEAENQPPVAVNDERGPVRAGTVVEVDVLSNDRDPDGDVSELTIVETGDRATVAGDTVIVTTGEETVVTTYTIEDADGAQAQASITVLVIENQGPTITPLQVVTPFETAIDIDVSGQAIDPDDDDLFFVCCEDIRGGAVSRVATAANTFRLTFTPDDEFIGVAGFNYRVNDQKGHQVSGSVAVTVADPGNRAPQTVADTRIVPQAETVAVNLADLTSDVDGDALTYTLLSQPGGGVDVQIAGSIATVSVAREVEIGSAGEFTYQVSDGALTATGTISIEVSEGANRPPVPSDHAEDVPAAGSATIDLASLTTEPDRGDSVTYALGGDVTGLPPLELDLNGSILQIAAPASTLGEVATYTYVATDTRGASAEAVITISVVDPTAPPPSASNDTASTERNVAILVDVLANDSDPLGEGLTLDDVSAQWGTALIDNNELRFNPGDRVGTSTVTYTLRDSANRPATGTVAIETVGVPDKPAPPDATPGDEAVTLAWDEPADNGRTIEGYRIFRAGVAAPEVVGRVTSFTWDGLDEGAEYTFTLVAFNEIGDSLPSDPSPSVVTDQRPEQPAPPTVVRGEGQLEVNWEEPDNSGSTIERYELQIGPISEPPVPIVGQFEHTWQGLTNGDFYTFSVRARNGAGWGPWSAASQEVRPSAPPDAPTIGTTTRGTQSGALTTNWTNNSDNGAPIIEYEIGASIIGEPDSEFDPDARSFDWANLPNGVDMTFAVRARNEAGWSAWSASSNTMQACGTPSAPTNVTTVRGDTLVGLSWTAPNDGQVCPVQNYIVEAISNGAVAFTQNSSSMSMDFTGLTNGETYSFQVTPTNVIGTGSTSAESAQVTPAGPPQCPQTAGTFSSSLTAPRAVDLQWSQLAANNGAPIIDYEINDGTGYASIGGNQTSTQIADLANGTTYDFDIRAVNDVGPSARCASTSETTWALPSNVAVSASFDGDDESLIATGVFYDEFVPGRTNSFTFYRNGAEVQLSSPLYAGASSGQRSMGGTVTLDGTYRVEFEACNEAGCVLVSTDDLEVALAAPPDPLTAANITLSAVANTNVYSAAPGIQIGFTLTAPNDNGSDITKYVTEIQWGGSSGDWHDAGQIHHNSVSSSSEVVTVNNAYTWRGYSSHPTGRNWGETYTFRVRSQAENAKGLSEYGPWVTINPPPPDPVIDFSEVQAYNCTPSGSAFPVQCHRIRVEMYGFTPSWPGNPLTEYTFGVASSSRNLWWIQSATSQAARPEDRCDSVPIATDQYGTISGFEVFCLSRLGADVWIATAAYSGPLHPGVPG